MDEPWSQTEETPCADCGALVRAGGRGFALGAEDALCWDCSLRRGGRYDAGNDVWDVAPEVTDLTSRRSDRED